MRTHLHFIVGSLLGCLLLNATGVFSQTDSSNSTKSNSLVEGKWALQFQLTQLTQLQSLQGYNYSLSVKKQVTNEGAIRIGLGYSAIRSASEIEKRDGTNNTLLTSATQTVGGWSVNLVAQYIRYIEPDADVNFYFGAGPLLDYYFQSSPEEKRWSIGLSATIGVEWFATRSISFLGEYGASVMYTWNRYVNQDDKYSSPTPPPTFIKETKTWRLNAAGARLGISLYF